MSVLYALMVKVTQWWIQQGVFRGGCWASSQAHRTQRTVMKVQLLVCQLQFTDKIMLNKYNFDNY
jgi:hypothetical protein